MVEADKDEGDRIGQKGRRQEDRAREKIRGKGIEDKGVDDHRGKGAKLTNGRIRQIRNTKCKDFFVLVF